MIAAENVAAVLLAAGASSRFGTRDKLAEPLDGTPLGLHAAMTLGGFPFVAKIAVTRAGGPDFSAAGFDSVRNPEPEDGLSSSIRIGVSEASKAGAKAVLIALADMPFVTSAHFAALMEAIDRDNPVVGSSNGQRASPPVIFAASEFPALKILVGDIGARALLRKALLVEADNESLSDIDTPCELSHRSR